MIYFLTVKIIFHCLTEVDPRVITWLYIVDFNYFQVNMKVSLGFGGVILVLLSVFSSNGVAGYAGLKNTVFVLEVSFFFEAFFFNIKHKV